MSDKINETAAFLAPYIKGKTQTAVILGSGLGKLAAEIKTIKEWEYKDIPNFPVSTVEGHAGKLILGILGKTCVLAMDGSKTAAASGMRIQIFIQLHHNEGGLLNGLQCLRSIHHHKPFTSPKGRSSTGKMVPRHRARPAA